MGMIFNGIAILSARRSIASGDIPAAPSSLEATPTSSTVVDLSWTDNADNEDGFKIERGTDGINFSQIDTAAANATSYSDTGLTPGTQYYYRVRAYTGGENSAYSNVATATPRTLVDNITAHWRMDELSGAIVDSVGSNDLARSGSVYTVNGKPRYGQLLSAGDSSYLSIADNADLSMGDIDFAFAGWVQLLGKGSNRVIFSKYNATAGTDLEYALFYASSPDRFRFLVNPDGSSSNTVVDADSLGSPAINTWYYIVVWHDATANTINIQVNDGTVDSTAHSTGVNDGGTQFRFGSFAGGTSFLSGKLSGWLLWKNDIPTSAERTELYNSGEGIDPFDDDEVAVSGVAIDTIDHWRMRSAAYYNGYTYLAWSKRNKAGVNASVWEIAKWNHSTEAWSAASEINTADNNVDDHSAPEVHIIQNGVHAGKLLVALGRDGADEGDISAWRSDTAEDITAWTSVLTINQADAAYPKFIETSSGTIWLFYRDTSNTEYYRTSTDGGDTWSGASQIFSFNAYGKYAASGDEIHVIINENVGGAPEYQDIYYVYTDDNGANWKQADGTPVTLPAGTADLDTVFTSAVGEGTRDADIILDGSANPYLLFVDDKAGTKTVTRAHYSAGWVVESIADTSAIVGDTYTFMAFAAFDPTSQDTVYIPQEDAVGRMQLVEWTRSGGSWSEGSTLTSIEEGDVFRPVHVKGGQAALKVIYSFVYGFTDSDWLSFGAGAIRTYPEY